MLLLWCVLQARIKLMMDNTASVRQYNLYSIKSLSTTLKSCFFTARVKREYFWTDDWEREFARNYKWESRDLIVRNTVYLYLCFSSVYPMWFLMWTYNRFCRKWITVVTKNSCSSKMNCLVRLKRRTHMRYHVTIRVTCRMRHFVLPLTTCQCVSSTAWQTIKICYCYSLLQLNWNVPATPSFEVLLCIIYHLT